MARRVNQALQEAWRQRIERQRRSGRTIADFCRSEGISQASFHAWRRKLRGAPSGKRSRGAKPQASLAASQGPRGRRPSGAGLARGPQGRPSGAAGFLELPVRAASPSPWIELALADGTVIRLPQQNTAALVAALRVLRGQPLTDALGEGCRA